MRALVEECPPIFKTIGKYEILRELRPGLPQELDDVVRRTLRKNRDERYRNMEELLTDLEPLVRRMQPATGTP
jgi:hypothetical protein